MTKKFVDLSEHNIINNYDGFVNSGLCGCIIKATEGCTYKDSSFESKYNNLHGKIPLGAYHMLCRTSEPEQQAVEFYKKLEGKQWEMLPVVDVEYSNIADVAEEYTHRFIEKFKELSGIIPIIYTGLYYCRDNFSQGFINNNKWWIASYGTSKKPDLPNLVAWQYTESCNDFTFISGNVDCSYLYDESIIDGTIQTTKDYLTNDIQALQHELNVQGFRDKNGNELIEDGILGELTLSALPTVHKGAQGNITKFIQSKVGVETDGIFGDLTEDAILTFQHINNLTCDGIVGRNTWKELLK